MLRSRACPKRKPIKYHIHSSVWCSIKSEFSVIIENSSWIVGDGQLVNFWNDNWSSQILANTLNPNPIISDHLEARVCDFLLDYQWNIPNYLQNIFPIIGQLTQQVTIPKVPIEDYLSWNHSKSGYLSLKDAYCFKSFPTQHVHWAKIIWSPDIPPSKSMLVWRSLHCKLPTDENLMARGCNLASVCSNCLLDSETIPHLFFHCPYALKIWAWLTNLLNIPSQINSFDDAWKICDRHWSPQCSVVVKSSVINVFNIIWCNRNQTRFQGKHINWRAAINIIISNVHLSGTKTSKTAAASMTEFVILKAFRINIHPPKAPSIKEVLWQPPIFHWIKANTDGVMVKNPTRAASGGIFRDSASLFKGGFAQNVDTVSPFEAELVAAFTAIEIAFSKGWLNLWLETDSQLVMLAFKTKALIPCSLRNRWLNCLELLKDMNFFCKSHYIEEGTLVQIVLLT